MMAALLSSPLARAALIALAAYSLGWWRGHAGASRACDVASLRAEIAVMRADKAAAAAAAQKFEAEARANADQSTRNAKIIEELRRDASPTPACRLSDADARRLRRIR